MHKLSVRQEYIAYSEFMPHLIAVDGIKFVSVLL